jgi:hypothetical protein
VTNPAITGYVTQASDILSHLPAKLASNNVIAVYDLRYPAQLILGQLSRFCRSFNPRFLQNLFGRIFAYPKNIGQRNPYRFVVRNINTNYTRHICSLFSTQKQKLKYKIIS